MPQRRVLILTTTFYPDPSVGGVRMTNWSRVLPELGWSPVVLTRYYGHAMSGGQLAEQVHPGVVVEYFDHPRGLKGPEDRVEAGSGPGAGAKNGNGGNGGGGLAKRARRLVQSMKLDRFIVPDPSFPSWWRLRHRALAAAREHRPDVIVTSGPPHSVHKVGFWLRERLEAEGRRVPLVVDFRDPFTMDPRFRPTGVERVILPALRRFERRVYEQADMTLCAIPVHARWVRMHYPDARARVRTLMNAAPPGLTAGRIEPIADPMGRASVRIVGVVGAAEVELCARAIEPLAHGGKPVALHLVGPIPAGLERARSVLGDRLVEVGPVSHDQALRRIAGADVLLSYLSEYRSTFLGLSSKLFEFLATGKPVIEVNPTGPDRHLLRREAGAKVLVRPGVEELQRAIAESLERGSDGTASALAGGAEYRHSWMVRARPLAQWLNELADGGRLVSGDDARAGW